MGIYGWQTFYKAMQILAGDGTQDDRLNRAITQLRGLKPESDLPENVIVSFKTFMKYITSVDENIAATIKTLSPISKSQVVDDVISMYNTICKEIGAEQERNSRI